MATAPTTRRRHALPASKAVSVISDRLSLRVPPSAWTLAGFRAWVTGADFPEHVRVGFIDEEIYLDMSNEEIETHNKVKMEIARQLLTLIEEHDLGEFYGDGVLLTNEVAEVSNYPDASFVTWESIEKRRVHLVPREGEEGHFTEIQGTPDWVLEVVSASSVQKDTRQLRETYHRAGIAEYWLVDARGDEIVFQILHRRKNGYVAAPGREGWQRSRVFERSFQLVRKRNRADRWSYRLQVRAD